ncbi:hypothetical protein FQA39_LY03353 [Lamprigera yunnana]|nr:hypothetical protein FQA39_LY03353 [Lamprigera yunnana]
MVVFEVELLGSELLGSELLSETEYCSFIFNFRLFFGFKREFPNLRTLTEEELTKYIEENLSDDYVSDYSSSGEEDVPESDTSENSDIEVDDENVENLAQEHRFVHVEPVI